MRRRQDQWTRRRNAAAQNGAEVRLAKRYGFLGGMGTVGGAANFAGLFGLVHGETRHFVHGIGDDVLDRVDRLGGLNKRHKSALPPAFTRQELKCAADNLLLSSGKLSRQF